MLVCFWKAGIDLLLLVKGYLGRRRLRKPSPYLPFCLACESLVCKSRVRFRPLVQTLSPLISTCIDQFYNTHGLTHTHTERNTCTCTDIHMCFLICDHLSVSSRVAPHRRRCPRRWPFMRNLLLSIDIPIYYKYLDKSEYFTIPCWKRLLCQIVHLRLLSCHLDSSSCGSLCQKRLASFPSCLFTWYSISWHVLSLSFAFLVFLILVFYIGWSDKLIAVFTEVCSIFAFEGLLLSKYCAFALKFLRLLLESHRSSVGSPPPVGPKPFDCTYKDCCFLPAGAGGGVQKKRGQTGGKGMGSVCSIIICCFARYWCFLKQYLVFAGLLNCMSKGPA